MRSRLARGRHHPRPGADRHLRRETPSPQCTEFPHHAAATRLRRFLSHPLPGRRAGSKSCSNEPAPARMRATRPVVMPSVVLRGAGRLGHGSNPHRPRHRGTSEDSKSCCAGTECVPKGTAPSTGSAECPAAMAAPRDRRTRKTLGWRTSAQACDVAHTRCDERFGPGSRSDAQGATSTTPSGSSTRPTSAPGRRRAAPRGATTNTEPTSVSKWHSACEPM